MASFTVPVLQCNANQLSDGDPIIQCVFFFVVFFVGINKQQQLQ